MESSSAAMGITFRGPLVPGYCEIINLTLNKRFDRGKGDSPIVADTKIGTIPALAARFSGAESGVSIVRAKNVSRYLAADEARRRGRTTRPGWTVPGTIRSEAEADGGRESPARRSKRH
jgi:hypothetical protein